jgi:hypothetical protein
MVASRASVLDPVQVFLILPRKLPSTAGIFATVHSKSLSVGLIVGNAAGMPKIAAAKSPG